MVRYLHGHGVCDGGELALGTFFRRPWNKSLVTDRLFYLCWERSSSELFIVISVAIGLFVDVVSVTLIVPILPNVSDLKDCRCRLAEMGKEKLEKSDT